MRSVVIQPDHCVGCGNEACDLPVSVAFWCPKHLQREAHKVAADIAEMESVVASKREQLKVMVGEEADYLIQTAMIDPPPCPWCGMCLWAGGPCCAGMALQMQRYMQSPEYQAIVQQRRNHKQQTRIAKRARRVERLVAKRLTSWDAYDQLLSEQSSWEGMPTID